MISLTLYINKRPIDSYNSHQNLLSSAVSIYVALHPSPAPPVCARLVVLKYFIFCLDSFYLSLPFFSPLISSFSCAVALLRFVASLRRFISRRFASRRSACALLASTRLPSRRARLRCFVVTSVSIARRSNWGGARPRFDLWASASSGLGTGVAFGPRLRSRPRSAPVVSFVRWAFAPLRWHYLGKRCIASGGGGRGGSAGKWFIALRPRSSSRRWALSNVQVSSLLWVRARALAMPCWSAGNRALCAPYRLFGGDSACEFSHTFLSLLSILLQLPVFSRYIATTR